MLQLFYVLVGDVKLTDRLSLPLRLLLRERLRPSQREGDRAQGDRARGGVLVLLAFLRAMAPALGVGPRLPLGQELGHSFLSSS